MPTPRTLLAAGVLALVALGAPAAVACSNSAEPPASTGVRAVVDLVPAKAKTKTVVKTVTAAPKTVLKTKTVTKTKTAVATETVTAAPETVTVMTTVVAPPSTVVQTVVQTAVETAVQTETVTLQVEQAAAPQGLADTGSVYYENCSAARAAGAAPVMAGDPGYSSALDRDGDGIGCE